MISLVISGRGEHVIHQLITSLLQFWQQRRLFVINQPLSALSFILPQIVSRLFDVAQVVAL